MLPPGSLTYTVEFSEAISPFVDSFDFSLQNKTLGVSYFANAISWNADNTRMTLQYSDLPEGDYSLTLFSVASHS